jgi:cytochrome c oxidase subunit II
MLSYCKIVLLLILAGNLLPAGSARAADTNRPSGAETAEFKRASKQSLELLRRGATLTRSDWLITATARTSKWTFEIVDVRSKHSLFEKPDATTSATSEALPPLAHLVVPQRARVEVRVISDDAIHPFIVPGLGIKSDAVPGRLATVKIDTSKIGVFLSKCGDPCSAHARVMTFAIHIVDAVTFQRWLDARQKTSA